MATTTIVAEIEDVRAKIPTRGARGTVGVIYTPKEWIGKTVYIVLKRPIVPVPVPSASSSYPSAPVEHPTNLAREMLLPTRHLKKKKRLHSRH